MMTLRQMKASLGTLFTPLEDLSSSPQQLRRMLLIPRSSQDDVSSRGGRYTSINVTTGIMLCHDMDFAIPWIPLHIHGFHWMDRQNIFSHRGHYFVIRERERCPA